MKPIPVDELPRSLERRLRDTTSEHDHQATLVQWATWKRAEFPELRLLFAIPNGGHRDVRVAQKLKAEGVRPGVPDLLLPVARRGYHGLFLEMKAGRGRVSAEQRQWHEWLTEQNYCVKVCHGWQAAMKVLEWYLTPAPRP